MVANKVVKLSHDWVGDGLKTTLLPLNMFYATETDKNGNKIVTSVCVSEWKKHLASWGVQVYTAGPGG